MNMSIQRQATKPAQSTADYQMSRSFGSCPLSPGVIERASERGSKYVHGKLKIRSCDEGDEDAGKSEVDPRGPEAPIRTTDRPGFHSPLIVIAQLQ